MPRLNCPWFRASKNTWYVTLDGRQVSLGVQGKNSHKAALLAFAGRLAGRVPGQSPPVAEVRPQGVTVGCLVERFLTAAGSRLKPRTVDRYRKDAGALAALFGAGPADQVTGDDLLRWVGGMTVSDTTRAIVLRSVSAVFGWAAKTKLVRENPARGLPMPRTRARGAEAVVSESDHARLLAAATPRFRVVLRVLHATGCRPGEVAKITAETLDAVNGVAVVRDHKTDRTGKPRLIFLPPDLAAELGALAAERPAGPLLVTRRGRPWTADAIAQAVRKTRERAGVKAIAYGYRHEFATAALANGVPEAHVAELLGHSSTAMLFKHYSHLTTRAAALRAALGKVRG
jgi:integrase/recombinase XerC